MKEVTFLVPRKSWRGCAECWRTGVPHNGKEAAFGGPCYIRFGWCDHKEVMGMRLWPDRRHKRVFKVRKDRAGRWVWVERRMVR